MCVTQAHPLCADHLGENRRSATKYKRVRASLPDGGKHGQGSVRRQEPVAQHQQQHVQRRCVKGRLRPVLG